jgi:hypothetical protein
MASHCIGVPFTCGEKVHYIFLAYLHVWVRANGLAFAVLSMVSSLTCRVGV